MEENKKIEETKEKQPEKRVRSSGGCSSVETEW